MRIKVTYLGSKECRSSTHKRGDGSQARSEEGGYKKPFGRCVGWQRRCGVGFSMSRGGRLSGRAGGGESILLIEDARLACQARHAMTHLPWYTAKPSLDNHIFSHPGAHGAWGPGHGGKICV